MNKNTKHNRQAALRELLSSRRIGDQRELQAALRKRGFPATQATVSRDIREMGIVKIQVGPGHFAYQTPAAEAAAPPSLEAARKRLALLFRDFVVGINGTSHLVLVKTTPGNAGGVASLIDGLRRPGILGTVAGDDTILIVVDTEVRRTEVERDLRALLQGA
jgi:transcriptional regulator of arginine metabolism